MAALKTQGTEIYILDDTDSGNEVRKIGQITGFSGVGGQAGEIDVTDMDSTAREFLAGLKDNGTVSINVNWDPQDASHTTLDALVGGASKRIFIACSESATQPTYSAGYTLPTDRTTLDFTGSILSFSKDAETDNVWRGSLQIRVSGAITTTAAA